MVYKNMFSTNRQSFGESFNVFIVLEKRGKILESIYQDLFNEGELGYKD